MNMGIFCCCCRPKKAIDESGRTSFRHYGAATLTGYKPGKADWVNQDAYFADSKVDTKRNLNNSSKHIFGIFDGHGSLGHQVSSLCRDEFLSILQLSGGNFSKAFEYLQEKLFKSDIDIDSSGTTCTIVMIHEGKVETYNVGDSKAMIARRSRHDFLGSGFETKQLTYDHTPNKEEEFRRIVKYGGKVGSRAVIDDNGNSSVIQGPLRVWYRCTNIHKSFMGLAMTRSLGDSGAHKVGVTYEPYESYHDLSEQDEFVILGSDGIWDVISCEEAAAVINDYILSLPPIQSKTEWSPKEAAKILISRARRKWQSAAYIDDITCCIIKLTYDDGSPCFV